MVRASFSSNSLARKERVRAVPNLGASQVGGTILIAAERRADILHRAHHPAVIHPHRTQHGDHRRNPVRQHHRQTDQRQFAHRRMHSRQARRARRSRPSAFRGTGPAVRAPASFLRTRGTAPAFFPWSGAGPAPTRLLAPSMWTSGAAADIEQALGIQHRQLLQDVVVSRARVLQPRGTAPCGRARVSIPRNSG